jgi:hypothetical protein
MLVDVSFATPQVHEIINVALHRQYSPGIIFFYSKGGSNSMMSKTNTGISLIHKIGLSRGYAKQG